jgi:ferredoxin
LCEETCPEVFRLGDDDVADVIVGEIPPEAEDAAREAAEGCPVEAIKIEE